MIQQSSSAPKITNIDISGPARALALLRWSDYLLVVVCGLGAARVATDVIRALVQSQWVDVFTSSAVVAVFTFAAYTGWRHVGVIDPRVWRSYLLVFPLMVLLAAFMGLGLVVNWQNDEVNPLDNPQSFVMIFMLLQFAAVSVPGFVCVLYLKRTRVPPAGARLRDVLTQLWHRGGSSGLTITKHQRVNTRRGLAYGGLGALVLVVVMVIPVPDGRQASTVFRFTEQLNLLAFFLMVRARRYFQVSADSLLAVDRRPPSCSCARSPTMRSSSTERPGARSSTSRWKRDSPTTFIASDRSSRSGRPWMRFLNPAPRVCCLEIMNGRGACWDG